MLYPSAIRMAARARPAARRTPAQAAAWRPQPAGAALGKSAPTRATARLEQDFSHSARLTGSLLAEVARAHPTLAPERLQQLGQRFFATLALDLQDTRSWATMQHLELQHEQFLFAQARFKETLRGKLKAGLDVVGCAFRNNPQALSLYERAQALLIADSQ